MSDYFSSDSDIPLWADAHRDSDPWWCYGADDFCDYGDDELEEEIVPTGWVRFAHNFHEFI